MDNKKHQYTVISSYSASKKKRHFTTSIATIDPEFEKKLEELMSCDILYSELEYN